MDSEIYFTCEHQTHGIWYADSIDSIKDNISNECMKQWQIQMTIGDINMDVPRTRRIEFFENE